MSASQALAAYAQSAVAVKRMMDLRGPQAVVALLRALGQGAGFETTFQQTIHMRFEDFATMLERE